MKKERRSFCVLASMLVMAIIIGSLLHTSPALAWDTWPSAVNNDVNHTWTVVFDQAMNTATINSDNIYVSNDITGSSIVAGVSISASDSTHVLVSPPAGGWSTDASYYLIITQKVLTSANMPLKDEVRMPFRIVVETKAPSTIDVTNDGTSITVKVNGNQLSFDQPPYIANGSTMVPFRTIAEALGAQVDWDSAKQKITIMGDKTVELIVNSKTARVNGVSSTLDNPPVITGGRTMVPLRFVGEAMGAKVNYTSTQSSVLNSSAAGNTPGNIVNWGLACQQGDWIYYNSYAGEFYKIRTDGSGRTRLNDDAACFINVVGGWIYYNNVSDDFKLYKMRTDGSGRARLNDDDPWHINVVGDWIYYSDSNVGDLYKIRTDGSDRTKLNDDRAGWINVVGDWIYYCNDSDAGKLYKIRTDGSGRTRLNDDYSWYINVVSGWIYYSNYSDDYKLYKIRTDGSGRIRLNDDKTRSINVVGDWIYYYNSSDDGKIYKMRTDGSERTKLTDDEKQWDLVERWKNS